MTRAFALLTLSVVLAACSSEQSTAPESRQTAATPESTQPRVVPQPSASSDPQAVLQAWAEAMSLKDWDAAFLYWEAKGAGAGMNLEQFKKHWARLNNPEFEIHQGVSEGAAGALYYTAPVVLIDGTRRIEGEVVLRRITNAAGASAEDLRWHVESHTLEF